MTWSYALAMEEATSTLSCVKSRWKTVISPSPPCLMAVGPVIRLLGTSLFSYNFFVSAVVSMSSEEVTLGEITHSQVNSLISVAILKLIFSGVHVINWRSAIILVANYFNFWFWISVSLPLLKQCQCEVEAVLTIQLYLMCSCSKAFKSTVSLHLW